ncbi:MAG: HD domain-containing protein [Solirubrobacterales bacterium]
MKIEDLSKLDNGAALEIMALVSDKRIGRKKDGTPFITLIIQDNTGSMSFPLWDNYDHYMNTIEINSVIQIKGFINYFNGAVQIKSPVIRNATSYDYSDFIPSYPVPKELYDYFNDIVNGLEEKYKKIAIGATGAFGTNEKRWNDFTTCVAAEKFHGNKRGGLFIHTVGVMKAMDAIISNYVGNPFYMDAKDVISRDRLMLKAIVHDLMKAAEYDYEGIIKRKSIKMDHLVLGAAFIREVNKEVGNVLSPEELDDICYSILSHHGEFGNYGTKGIEDILLNIADVADSQIVNAVENKI